MVVGGGWRGGVVVMVVGVVVEVVAAVAVAVVVMVMVAAVVVVVVVVAATAVVLRDCVRRCSRERVACVCVATDVLRVQGTAAPVPATPGWFTGPSDDPAASTTQSYESVCPPGSYCAGGVRRVCPAGRYGGRPAEASSACEGACQAGFFCPANSTSPTQEPCGGVGLYCPPGSAAAASARPGEFTVGGNATTRSGVVPCPSGSYCRDGEVHPCPAGRFGCAERLGDADCNGPCSAGFFCPPNSTSSQVRLGPGQLWGIL
jgi:hypothetical protein